MKKIRKGVNILSQKIFSNKLSIQKSKQRLRSLRKTIVLYRFNVQTKNKNHLRKLIYVLSDQQFRKNVSYVMLFIRNADEFVLRDTNSFRNRRFVAINKRLSFRIRRIPTVFRQNENRETTIRLMNTQVGTHFLNSKKKNKNAYTKMKNQRPSGCALKNVYIPTSHKICFNILKKKND